MPFTVLPVRPGSKGAQILFPPGGVVDLDQEGVQGLSVFGKAVIDADRVEAVAQIAQMG